MVVVVVLVVVNLEDDLGTPIFYVKPGDRWGYYPLVNLVQLEK